MKVIPLPSETLDRVGFNWKAIIEYTDLVVAGLTASLQIFPRGAASFPAGLSVLRAGLSVVTNFDGGATSSLTVQVGDDGAVARLLPATQIHEDGTEIPYFVVAAGTTTQPFAYNAANGIDALFTSVGANLNALTQGKVELYLALVDISRLKLVT
jgi:hypothetical protein